MKSSRVTALVLLLIVAAALELVFVPIDRVLASPPNIPLITCPKSTTTSGCTFAADYYAGAGSLTYCFLGEGALYLKGVYYPLTQPGASAARAVGNVYCPAMRR